MTEPQTPNFGPSAAPLDHHDFTPRTWKVLAASCQKDGYAYGGGEARAVQMLVELELVTASQREPLHCMATERGRKLAERHAEEARRAK